MYPDMSVADYRKYAEVRIEALNHALSGLPEDQVRLHVCWGSYHGPHKHDIPLRVIEGSKTGEATRAVINTIVPFVLALVLVWYIPAFDSFPVEAAHPEFKIQDYKTIVGCFIAKIYLGKTRWHSGRQ